MYRLVRAACYFPAGGTEGGRHVAGPDEDRFTLLATALERLSGTPGPPGLTVIQLGSELPESQDWAIAAVMGSPVEVARSPPDPPAALEGTPDRILLAADGPAVVAPANDAPEPDQSPGDGSVALLYRARSAESEGDAERTISPSPTWLQGALVRYRALPENETVEWIGDWTAERSIVRARDPGEIARFRQLPPDGRSEGAYIPRARYLEGLASHWRFEGDRCSRCSAITFPKRGTCRSCGRSEGLSAIALPRDNLEVVATTTIGSGGQPTEFDHQVEAFGPYEVVLAELAPGLRVTLAVSDSPAGSIRIGDRIDTRLRRLYPMDGEWRYGRKAVPRPPG